MEKYDYLETIKEDIRNYIEDNNILDYEYNSKDRLKELLDEELWDSYVTGNNGNYYASEEQCEEYICHNLNLIIEIINEWGWEPIPKFYAHPAQYFDTAIRCYLLYTAIDEVVEEIWRK